MKTANNGVIKTAVSAVTFFLTGKLLFFKLFALFEPTIEGIHFQIIETAGKLPTFILFALMMAVITILIAVIWRLGPLLSAIRRAGVVGLIVAFMIACILLRHQLVKNYFNGVVRPFLQDKNQLPMNYSLDPANFVYYMFAGSWLGAYFLFFFSAKNIANSSRKCTL